MKLFNNIKKPYQLGLMVSIMFSSIIGLTALAPAYALSAPVKADTYFADASTDAACGALTQLNNDQDCTTGATKVSSVLETIVQIISFLAGAIAVVMIVLAGFKFITSGGDANKVASARNSLIYALIGIVVVALAQTIIHFALNNATQADPCASNSNVPAADHADCHK
jgi:hypothetical protein